MLTKAYRLDENKVKIKALVEMELLELSRVNEGTKKLIELETSVPRSSGRGNRRGVTPPSLETINQVREETNAEIEKENAILLEDRIEMFSFFARLCLPAVIPVKTWDKDHKRKMISDFVTATDEAFAMILFENNSDIFLALGESNKKTYKELKQVDDYKDTHTKWTSVNGKDAGWTEDGLERFETLVDETMLNRVRTEANARTYVDMDRKFYEGFKKDSGVNPGFVLNAGSGRKRKRRKNEL